MLGSFLIIAASLTTGTALETSSGAPATLEALITKPTVVFYEDRDSTALNQHVKDALFQAGKARGRLDSVSVVAIANVKEWNWFPARNFVLKAVRDTEAKVNIPIYLDFAGSMTLAPWSLPAKTSTVVVLSTGAKPLATFKGRLSQRELDELLSTLESLSK